MRSVAVATLFGCRPHNPRYVQVPAGSVREARTLKGAAPAALSLPPPARCCALRAHALRAAPPPPVGAPEEARSRARRSRGTHRVTCARALTHRAAKEKLASGSKTTDGTRAIGSLALNSAHALAKSPAG